MTAEASQLRDFAERYTSAWCSGDPSSVATFFSMNGSLSVNGIPAMGRDAITEVARGFMTAFPDMALTMDDLTIAGEQAVFHWTLDGSNSGPAGTGKRVRFSGFEEWKFGTDGLIEESQGHFDEADYTRQLQHGFDQFPR